LLKIPANALGFMNVMLLHSSYRNVGIFTQLVKLCVSLLITKYYCSYNVYLL